MSKSKVEDQWISSLGNHAAITEAVAKARRGACEPPPQPEPPPQCALCNDTGYDFTARGEPRRCPCGWRG